MVTDVGGWARDEDAGRYGMAPSRRAATIKDVAAAAGVGVATVSRVLSGTGPVSPATRERVRAAVRELGYRPSAPARGLKLRRTGGLGLVVPDVTDPFCAELVAGVLECARTFGEHVIVDASRDDPDREAEIVEGFAEQRVDGVVAVPSGDAAGWRAAAAVGLPVVFAGRAPADLPEVPAVLCDDRAGVRSAVDYLVGLGHRRPAFLGGPAPGAAADTRERAFRDTVAELGAVLEEDLVVRARSGRDSAYAAVAGLFQRRPDVTAVLASGHLLGEAAVLVAREFDLRVPADVSIVMVDDMPWAELCDPPLTAVARPARELGHRACEMLRRGPGGPARSRPAVLPAELVVRGSCSPPAGMPGTAPRRARAR